MRTYIHVRSVDLRCSRGLDVENSSFEFNLMVGYNETA